jgi:hypothetical protein
MFTTIGYLESVDQAGAFNALTALADQHVRVSGDDIQVPTLNQVVAVSAGVENVAANRARLVSPSLRVRSNFLIAPTNGATAVGVEPGSPQAMVDLRTTPLVLAVGEQLNVEAFANPVAAQSQWGMVWLADGPIAPLAGPIFTIRATSATALVPNGWSNVAVAFDEDLPRGRYQMVGLWPISSGMIAARAVFVGGTWRPGALGSDSNNDLQHPMFRNGEMGVYGEFEDIEPPTFDCLSLLADATQEFYIDIIQVRAGGA